MNEFLNSRLRFGIIGGILGGLIAIAGFLILWPPVDSLFLFVLLRVAIGATVAMIVGPVLLARKSKKTSE